MQIRKATTQDLECVRGTHAGNNLSDLSQVLSAGAVQFFLNHHCDGKISADIRQGCVYLAEDPADGIVGTVTVKADEISRLFVLPEQQRKGYGQALLAYAEQQVFAAYPQATLDASLPAKAMYLKQGYHAQAFHSLPAEGLTFLCYDVMVKAR